MDVRVVDIHHLVVRGGQEGRSGHQRKRAHGEL